MQAIGDATTRLNQALVDDEAFIKEFHQKPYVFEVVSPFNPENCAFRNPGDSICFCKVSYRLGCEEYTVQTIRNVVARILKLNDSWTISSCGEELFMQRNFQNLIHVEFKKLAEAVEVILNRYKPTEGLIYMRGILVHSIESHLINIDNEFLLDEPDGTYLIKACGHFNYIVINMSGKIILERLNLSLSDTFSNEKMDQIIVQALQRGPTRISNMNEEFFQKLRICQSMLDISFLKNLKLISFKQNLDRWTFDFLDGVKYLIFNVYDPELDYYVELIIRLAKLGRTDIFLYFGNHTFKQDIISYNKCIDILVRMREELTGEPLSFAIDCFLKIIIERAPVVSTKLKYPEEDAALQEFYNNPNKRPTFLICLPESKRKILVHDVIIGKFSNMFNTSLNGSWREANDGVFTFNDFPDVIVEQFLRIAYGFPADFSNCDCIVLLQFAKFVDAPLFLNLINKHVDESVDELESQSLLTMIEFEAWELLPNKKKFLQAVGESWLEIIEQVPEPDRDRFRQQFLEAWGRYLKKK